MWPVLTYIMLCIVCVILFFNRPLILMYLNTASLPMYFASKVALELLHLKNTKENRKYIKKMCCNGRKFSEDFLDYANGMFTSYTIENLGILIYEYISFKEKAKEVHKNESD